MIGSITPAPTARVRSGRGPARTGQSGAVLLVSLVLLVALTLLGISTMNTSQLEEKMAANSQEYGHAFQAAETALSQGFNNSDAWEQAFAKDYENAWALLPTATKSTDGGEYTARFLIWTTPPLGSLYSSTSFQAAHFNFRSTGGPTVSGTPNSPLLSVTVNGGAYQLAPKQE